MRTARGMKIFAVAGALALLTTALAACGGSTEPAPAASGTEKPKLKVGLAYDIGGRGDKSFNDSAAAGLEAAKATLDIETKELPAVQGESEADKTQRLLTLCQGGYNPVIAVGFAYANSLKEAAATCPTVKFAIIDDASVVADNVAGLTFAEEQGSFLVGVAAALKSTSGSVGFVGGCDIPLIHKFEAGFKAGAKAIKDDITFAATYIPLDNCGGFNAPAEGKAAAAGLYADGADVVFHAAGGSGAGVFEAAKEAGKLAIGVDSDQYLSATADIQPFILTSMLKRVDNAVFNFISDYSAGNFASGQVIFDLSKDGVGYSTSGGFVDDIKTTLEDYKAKIISGEIVVPTDPAAV